MRLSPIVLSAATAWAGQALQHNPDPMIRRIPTDYQKFSHYSGYHPELSTEYFLVPPNIGAERGDSSVASVVSVPAPNRTISIYRGPGRPGGGHVDDPKVGPISRPWPLLRPQIWALPLAAFSAAAMLLMAGFEIFVLCKVCWILLSFN